MRRTLRQMTLSIVAACAALVLYATPALAQQTVKVASEEGVPDKWMTAIRGGLGLNNTEGIVGLMWQSAAMGPAKYLRFRPAIQASFASGLFDIGGILDLAAEMKIPASKWTLLFGGGVATGLKHFSGGCEGCTGTNTALTGHQMFVGFQNPNGLFIEVRASAGWNHGQEILAGYYFKGRKK